jgi:hypothetical protein
MVRCGLTAKIYYHTVALKSMQLKDSAAVTLMGTDVERIVETLKFVHELWASIPEIGVAVWLLARQVYGASAVPLIICLGQLYGKLGFLHASLIPMPSLCSSPPLTSTCSIRVDSVGGRRALRTSPEAMG